MPAAALLFLKGLPWKQIGICLAVIALGALLWKAPWAESRGFHKRDAEVQILKTNNDTLTANLRGAQDALAQQERAVLAVQAAGDAKVAEGNANYAKAQKANQALVERNAALAKSVEKRPGAGDPCTTSSVLQGMVI